MEAIISLIIWGIIISKIVKAVKENTKQKPRNNASRRQAQQRPVQRTTQAERDAYYYSQQNTKERLLQKYGSQKKDALKSDILSRAKGNVQENTADAVKQQMHAEVCRDYRDNVQERVDLEFHKAMSKDCDTGENSDIIKKVNDLIVTGYSGDMVFDRDFIAEGVDMLNRFTV